MILKGKRIFIIEDDTHNRFIMQSILQAAGAVVDGDRWRSDAYMLKLVNYLPVDLITLDLTLLNGISGYHVFDQIRANRLFDGVRIVAVSGAEPHITSEATRQRGFHGFIAKPINVKLYPQQLAAVLDGQPVWHVPQF
jgi:CheY-like chemotaxis protein